jgi:hypothetical protein
MQSEKAYPCLCLNRGFFLLITYNFPFLLTILQSALRFLMDALTFIIFYLRYALSLATSEIIYI